MEVTKPQNKKANPVIIRFNKFRSGKPKDGEPKSSSQKLTHIVNGVKVKPPEQSEQLEQEELNIKTEPEEPPEVSDPQELEPDKPSLRPEHPKDPKDMTLSLIKVGPPLPEHVNIKTEPQDSSEHRKRLEPPERLEFAKPKKDIEPKIKLNLIKVELPEPEKVIIKTEPLEPRKPSERLESVKAKKDIESNIKLIKVEPPEPEEVNIKIEPLEPPEDLKPIKLEAIGCDDPLGNDVVPNELVNSSEPSFNCSKCSKVFRDFHTLHNHLMSHNNEVLEEKPTICKVCKKCIPKSQVEKHMKSHTTERRNTISKSINFYAKSCLKRQNQRSYTGDKPFACDDCGARFLTCDNMKRHQLIHQQARPYMCNVCLERFSEKICLARHQLRKGHKNMIRQS